MSAAYSASQTAQMAGAVVASPASKASKRTNEKARRAQRERQRIYIAVLVTSLFLVFLGYVMVAGTGPVSTGITAERDSAGRLVVSWVVPASFAYDQGVLPGAVVQERPGEQPVGNSNGGTVDLSHMRTVTVQQGNKTITLNMSTQEGNNILRRWGYALIGLIFVFVGAPVFIKARQRSAATTFYIFCVTTAVALATTMVSSLNYGWAMALQFASMVLWAGSFAYFFFQFPSPPRSVKVRQIFEITLGAAVVTLLAGYAWVLLTSPANYTWLRPIYFLYIAGCVAAGILMLIGSFIGEKSQEVRRQRMVLVVGTSLAVGPNLLLGLIPSMIMGQALVSIETTAFTLGFLPLFFAYAITQHQLLGIRSFVKRSVVYIIMGFTVLSAFFIMAAIATASLSIDWVHNEAGIFAAGLFVFLIAVSFGYVQKRVEWLVDRFVYHDAYDYKQALLQFSTQLAAEQDLNGLTRELVERTCRMMNLDCGTLLLAIHPGEVSAMVVRKAPLVTHTGSLSAEMLQATNATVPHVHANAVGLLTGNFSLRSKETLPIVQGQEGEQPYLLSYTHYGSCGDWLPQSLQSELVRQGMDLRHANAPTELFSFYAGPAYLTSGTLSTGLLGRRGDPEETLLHKLTGSRTSHLHPDAMRPFLGVPLWTRQRFVGILCLGSKKTGERYSKDDLSLLTTLGGQAALAIYNAQLYEMREQALLDTITALAHAIEAKDTYTLNHCEMITGRAVALAQYIGLPQHEVENIRLGSILHDVGKIGIPDAILNKPAKLTDEEYERIKEHAVIGARIVQSVGALQGVVPIVRHHQERYDGTGYPDGIKGDEIPVGARIIAVVDAYGAMTEDRVYRKAPGHEIAVSELKRWSGRQFDPEIAEAFIRLLEAQPELTEG